jgi:hypothetical protein
VFHCGFWTEQKTAIELASEVLIALNSLMLVNCAFCQICRSVLPRRSTHVRSASMPFVAPPVTGHHALTTAVSDVTKVVLSVSATFADQGIL